MMMLFFNVLFSFGFEMESFFRLISQPFRIMSGVLHGV